MRISTKVDKDSSQKEKTVQKKKDLALEVMDETNVTPYVFTKIADAVLEDYDIINEDNRHRGSVRKQNAWHCVWRQKRYTVKEEHYTVLSLPENKYIGRANPKSKKAEDIFGRINFKELLVAR